MSWHRSERELRAELRRQERRKVREVLFLAFLAFAFLFLLSIWSEPW